MVDAAGRMVGDFLLLSFENDRHVIFAVDHGFFLPFDEDAVYTQNYGVFGCFLFRHLTGHDQLQHAFMVGIRRVSVGGASGAMDH